MKHILTSALALSASLAVSAPSIAQSYFLGEIFMFSGNYCPRDTTMASGQTVSIGQNSALFSLLGTRWGGDGRTSFSLPDLNGRMPMGAGQGPGLSHRVVGQRFGQQYTTLTTDNLPGHTHTLYATDAGPATPDPYQASLATFGLLPNGNPARVYTDGDASADQTAHSSMIQPTGGHASTEETAPTLIQQPVLGVTYCIATQGTYPSRN